MWGAAEQTKRCQALTVHDPVHLAGTRKGSEKTDVLPSASVAVAVI